MGERVFWQLPDSVIREVVDYKYCSVLEIGCGTGELAVRLAKHGCSVHAIDRSERVIRIANHRHVLSPVVFEHVDFFSLSSTRIFDLAISHLVLPLVQNKHGFARKIFNHASRWIVTIPVMLDASKPLPVWAMYETTIQELLKECGLTCIEMRIFPKNACIEHQLLVLTDDQ